MRLLIPRRSRARRPQPLAQHEELGDRGPVDGGAQTRRQTAAARVLEADDLLEQKLLLEALDARASAVGEPGVQHDRGVLGRLLREENVDRVLGVAGAATLGDAPEEGLALGAAEPRGEALEDANVARHEALDEVVHAQVARRVRGEGLERGQQRLLLDALNRVQHAQLGEVHLGLDDGIVVLDARLGPEGEGAAARQHGAVAVRVPEQGGGGGHGLVAVDEGVEVARRRAEGGHLVLDPAQLLRQRLGLQQLRRAGHDGAQVVQGEGGHVGSFCRLSVTPGHRNPAGLGGPDRLELQGEVSRCSGFRDSGYRLMRRESMRSTTGVTARGDGNSGRWPRRKAPKGQRPEARGQKARKPEARKPESQKARKAPG
ncbi:hypothetical protein VDGD_20825 [Verticillium dahliae]|nr:hypothetical protein VDGD_20825 [Verticillium dahliae]